ncbi:hypothetical protein Memar_2036 [Methanoculleus marisnigri JR1]|uniref:Uncharacterized protein n=2 Tax=Methanoculleus TaxID=45989 RepID=A3CX62_METMJ|nr:hypothetical protein Memar_2036 [Methanoculleus marisnigri JR1]
MWSREGVQGTLEVTGRLQGSPMDVLETIMTRRSVREYIAAGFDRRLPGRPSPGAATARTGFTATAGRGGRP